MTRSIFAGLFAVVGVGAIALLPSSCQSGGVGDPCVPEGEYDPTQGGFNVAEGFVESRSFQCETRICLVNYFQGRVSCPLGQPPPTVCTPATAAADCSMASASGKTQTCAASGVFAPDCTSDQVCADAGAPGLKCTGASGGHFCKCAADADCPKDAGYSCDQTTHQCTTYVCHAVGQDDCQDPTGSDNTNKACCVPGTDTPVSSAVCGQCDNNGNAAKPAKDAGNRSAANSVYCSCRCGVPDDPAHPIDPNAADAKDLQAAANDKAKAEPDSQEANFNFCECPDGFACTEVRPDLGIGDKLLAGKYCVKSGDDKTTASTAASECGSVYGYAGGSGMNGSITCKGSPATE